MLTIIFVALFSLVVLHLLNTILKVRQFNRTNHRSFNQTVQQ